MKKEKERKIMLRISRRDRAALESVGLLKYRRVGINEQEPNFIVVNRQRSRNKHYYVAEDKEVMIFLEHYDRVSGIRQVTKDELDILLNEKLLYPNRVQHPGQYNPKALAYASSDGRYYIEMLPKFMARLNKN